MNGTDFAKELLFIKWKDGDYYGAADAWVNDCPEDANPRSEDNPFTYTWEETLEDGWHEDAEDNQWYIVGARRADRHWLGVDVDGDSGHEVTVDFDKDDVKFPTSGALLALSKSGWPHCYTLHAGDSAVQNAVDGVDVMSDSPSSVYRGAVSPWHDDRREVLNDPEPKDMTPKLETALGGDGGFVTAEVDGERHELLERKRTGGKVEVDIPEDAPDDVPLGVRKLAEVRTSELRYEYGESPWHADSHLGMLLIANGYSVGQAFEFMREHPPHKDTGFDAEKTQKHLKLIKRKMEAGDLHPPTEKLDVDVSGCGCAVHSGLAEEATAGIIAPHTPINRADPTVDTAPEITLDEVRRETRNFVGEAIELGQDVVLSPEPAAGKSHAAAKELANGRQPGVLATNTHRNINEFCEWLVEEGCRDFGLPPSASRDGTDQDGDDLEHLDDTHCPTYCGEHGEAARDRMKNLVDACDGSTRKAHALAGSDDTRFEPFPCQEGEDGCNYVRSWETWDADARIQVCHYSHLNMTGLMTQGDNGGRPRTVVIDEFPAQAFETSWTGDSDDDRSVSKLKENVAEWLSQWSTADPSGDAFEELDRAAQDPLSDLRRARTWEDLYSAHVPWDAVDQRDVEGAVDNGWHPATGLVAYLCAKSTRLSNGWRYARAGKYSLAVEPNGDVHLMRPPEFRNARQVVGLDATACEPMWRAATGLDGLRVVDTMTLEQKRAYYKHALNLDVVQVTDWMKSMAGVGNQGNTAFKPEHAEVVIDYLEHAAGGGDTGLITSRDALTAMHAHPDVGVGAVTQTGYYGNFKGENRFGGINVGGVFGSNHPGDRTIEKWAAYRGESAERNEAPDGDRSDWELTYQNEVGDAVFDYFLEGAVKQAIVRFSRGEERGIVVVYTDRIPDEVPAHKAALTSFVDSRQDVLEAVDTGAGTVDAISAEVHWHERTVRRALEELVSAGAVREEGGRFVSNGPVSRVGRIGDDGSPILEYRGTVGVEREVVRGAPPDEALLGVRALLMEVVDGEDGADGSVQTGLSAAVGAD